MTPNGSRRRKETPAGLLPFAETRFVLLPDGQIIEMPASLQA